MPLLWKKSKIGRVSRFVSDLKSSKHGESLVVETGFPTSIVDLMMKNRDRLKKPSSKKKKQSSMEISSTNSPPPPHPSLLRCPSLPIIPPHLSPSSFSSSSYNSTMLMVPASPSSIKTVIKNRFSCSGEEEKVVVKVSAPRNRAFLLILKLLFVLILAIGTKKIAIVITVSAFVLLLLEFSGKNLFCFLKLCPDARQSFNCVVDSVLSSVNPKLEDENETHKDNKLFEKEETLLVGDYCGLINDSNNNNNNGAIIIAEDRSTTMNGEIQIEPGFDSLHCGCRWGFVESDQKKWTSTKDEELIEDENIKSSKKKGSAKFKSKMLKKFVPKNFRGSKKKKTNNEESYLDSSSEFVSNYIGEEEKLNRVDEHEEEDDDDDDDDHEEPEEGEDDDDDDDDDNNQVYTSSEFSLIELETDFGANAIKITTWSSQQLIPFVIILTGLIGGRVIALVLAVFWCLFVKSIMRIATRNK